MRSDVNIAVEMINTVNPMIDTSDPTIPDHHCTINAPPNSVSEMKLDTEIQIVYDEKTASDEMKINQHISAKQLSVKSDKLIDIESPATPLMAYDETLNASSIYNIKMIPIFDIEGNVKPNTQTN